MQAPEEEMPHIGEIADKYLNEGEIPPILHDKTFGIYTRKGLYYIGKKQATIVDNDIIIDDEKFKVTPGLWELLISKQPEKGSFTGKDFDNYGKLMIKTNALHRNYDPNSPYPRASDSQKWMRLLRHIWYEKGGYEGKGVVVILSDPNALFERLELLLASKEAGNTGV